ncbi:MAG: recombinase family protein [Pseudomonadota bacterium]
MKPCFGYIRVSTPKQGEGVSLDVQKDDIAQAAKQRGLLITEWFVELETASKVGRPIFNAMAGRLKRGHAEALMLHKLDRGSRNMTDWGDVSRLLDQGIEFHIATDPTDFNSRAGRFIADMLAALAADFSRNQREETKKGLRGRLKQGLFPYRPPLGYLKGGKGKPKPPCPETAHIVAKMFELYATGDHSYESLREESFRLGLSNHNGGMISLHGMEKLLSNPFYHGVIKIDRTGEVFQGVHTPIISKTLFNKVQDMRRYRGSPKITRHQHRFMGLFHCHLCSGPLVPERQKAHVYYRCHRTDCAMTCHREDRLDHAIRRKLAELELTPAACKQLLASWKESDLLAKITAERRSITAKIEAHEAKKARLADLLLEDTIDLTTHKTKRDEIDFMLVQLRQALSEIPDVSVIKAERTHMLKRMSNLRALYDSADRTGQRQLLRETFVTRTADKESVYLTLMPWADMHFQMSKLKNQAKTGVY